jgi:hypothetical protein
MDPISDVTRAPDVPKNWNGPGSRGRPVAPDGTAWHRRRARPRGSRPAPRAVTQRDQRSAVVHRSSRRQCAVRTTSPLAAHRFKALCGGPPLGRASAPAELQRIAAGGPDRITDRGGPSSRAGSRSSPAVAVHSMRPGDPGRWCVVARARHCAEQVQWSVETPVTSEFGCCDLVGTHGPGQIARNGQRHSRRKRVDARVSRRCRPVTPSTRGQSGPPASMNSPERTIREVRRNFGELGYPRLARIAHSTQCHTAWEYSFGHGRASANTSQGMVQRSV